MKERKEGGGSEEGKETMEEKGIGIYEEKKERKG